jgi:hypothetical protein
MGWIAGAIVFAALLFAFPRFVLWSCAASLVIGAIAFGAIYFMETQASAKREAERRLLRITVKVDPSICADPKYPLAIGIRNSNDFTVNSVTFRVYGRRPGHSNAIYSSSYTDDKIIKKHEFSASCWSLSDFDRRELDAANLLPKDMEWEGDLSYFDKGS